MFGRRRTRLTREGWYYLLVLAFVVTGAMLREINLLLIMAGLLVGPLLINWRMVIWSLQPLRASRRVAESVVAGETLSVDIAIQSRASWLRKLAPSAWCVTVDDLLRRVESREPPLRSGVMFWRIPRGQSARVSYRGRLLRRGRYVFGRLAVSSSFPLGLVRRTILVDAPQDLLVLPRLGRLTPAWRALCRRTLYAPQGQRTPQVALEGDFHSLRDWRPGDARRQIHWRTTARRRAPVVRRLERPRNPEVVILLDLWRPYEDGSLDVPTERAISFAATVVNDICRQGQGRILLGTAAGRTAVYRGPASTALLHECLAHLATVEGSREDHFDALVTDMLSDVRRDAQVVVVTTRNEAAEESERWQGWTAPSGRPVRPGLVIDAGSSQLDEFFVCDGAGWETEPAEGAAS